MKINFDMDLLRTLIAFADTGSFKGAAHLVSRTQPTISMQMKKLEEIVGQDLFIKRGRDLVFNENGSRLALQARQILTLHDRIVEEWHPENLEGKVSLGIPDDYASLILPNMLDKFSHGYENVTLDIVTNTSPVLTQMLGKGELDLAVLATTTPEEGDVILRREDVVWATSPDHEAHVRSPLPLALFSDESPICRATMAALQRFSVASDRPFSFRVNVKSKSWAVLAAAAAAGYAVTTMARSVVPDNLRILTTEDGFPDPGHITLVMRGTPDSQSLVTSRLAEKILEFFQSGLPIRS